jgi:hypothetical protein
MRVFTSLVVAIVFAFTLGVSRQASALPDVAFASGVRLPTECELDVGTGALDCDAAGGVILTFTVIITVSTEGMQGYSFGAEWDSDGQAELTNVSGTQAFDATLYVSKVPPLVNAAFSPDNGPRSAISGITQSTGSAPGLLINWAALSASPESSLYTGAVLQGASYRAGRISVTVSTGNTGSVLRLGFFDPNKDAFLAAGGALVGPTFNIANINTAPEPAAVLSALAGLAAIGYLGVRSRRSR